MKGAQILQHLKHHSPTILSCIGAAGVVATTVTAVKATPKAITHIRHDSRINHDGDPNAYTKLEAVKSCWKCYIPAALIGVSTIACIFGANALNRRQQAALTSAYMLLENTYKEYQNKVKELYGEETDISVRKNIVEDKYMETYDSKSGDELLFYEHHYGEFFNCTRGEVLSAEYRFNQKFASRGYATLNDFYELLGLPKTDIGSTLGWIFDDEFYICPWIDFKHELLELEDGMECYIINITTPPSIDYLDI